MTEDRQFSMDQAREQMEERWRSDRNRHRLLGAGLCLVAAGVGALAWMVYPAIRQHDSAIAELPGVRQSVNEVEHQVTATQKQLMDWSGRQDQMRSELTKGLETVRGRIAAVAKQTQEAAAGVTAKLRSELVQRVDELTTRLAGLESSGKATNTEVAALKAELEQARGQLSEQGRELVSLRSDLNRQQQENVNLAATSASTGRQLAEIDRRQNRYGSEFDALSAKIALRRVDFEVSKGQPRQIIPGVNLGVNGTNVDYQRTNGWVSAPNGKTIWLRDLRTQEPVVLYTDRDGRKHELVITRVSREGIIGYVLAPMDGEPSSTIVGSAGAE
jgi:hypothetical protein